MAEVNSAFAALPSAERAHYRNDPGAWLDAIATPPPEDEAEVPSAALETPSDETPTPPPPEVSPPGK